MTNLQVYDIPDFVESNYTVVLGNELYKNTNGVCKQLIINEDILCLIFRCHVTLVTGTRNIAVTVDEYTKELINFLCREIFYSLDLEAEPLCYGTNSSYKIDAHLIASRKLDNVYTTLFVGDHKEDYKNWPSGTISCSISLRIDGIQGIRRKVKKPSLSVSIEEIYIEDNQTIII